MLKPTANKVSKLICKRPLLKDEKKEGRYLRREFSYTKFQQTMILPDDVDKEKIGAHVENGVLNITLPKFTEAEKEKAKKFIDVK